jgi:hypothetical protein
VAKKRKQKRNKSSFPTTVPDPVVNIAQRRSKRDALEPNRKPSVFIAVPTLDGYFHYSIGMAFGRAMASTMMNECPFRFKIHTEPGKRGIDYARNSIVRTFMNDTDDDWLMMIDRDQAVPENFWMLCTIRDADIVSGLTPVWVGNMDPEAMLRVNNYGVDSKGRCFNLPIPDETIQQPYRVPVAGTGCIAIRRRVFAPPPHGLGLNPFYFTREEDQKIKAGEDINFSVNANKAGFIVSVHPQVWFDHIKEMPLRQVDAYANALIKMEREGRQVTDEQRISIG